MFFLDLSLVMKIKEESSAAVICAMGDKHDQDKFMMVFVERTRALPFDKTISNRNKIER